MAGLRRYLHAVLIVLVALGPARSNEIVPPLSAAQQLPGTPTVDSKNASGTEASPLVVRILPTIKSDEEVAGEKSEAERKRQSDDRLIDLTASLATYTEWLFIATSALAVTTLGLFLVGYMEVRDTKRSIQALESSADAMRKMAAVTARRAEPIFFASGIQLEDGEETGRERLRRFRIKVNFLNFGETPALVSRISVESAFKEQLPVEPKYNASIDAPPTMVILARMELSLFQTGSKRELSDPEIDNLAAERTALVRLCSL
jgi:hypothetical protein